MTAVNSCCNNLIVQENINVSITNYYNEFLSSPRYYLMPKYQRPYSWEEKHIEDFWNDLLFALLENGNLPYLLGSIYLAKVDFSNLGAYVNQDILRHPQLADLGQTGDYCFVIDGQQRTTTFFLFLLALDDPDINLKLFVNDIPRLIPGKVDCDFFLALVSGTSAEPKTKSNRRLKETYDYFRERLQKYRQRDELLHFVKNNLQVVRIMIENNLGLASTLFVSQTDRGKRLTNLEKLKSTLIFYAQKIEKDADHEAAIDNLFGRLFESIEVLCSQKLYSRPENAEADVVRILNVMLLRENFYNNFLNDRLTESKNERKVEIWYESGEDRIYEAINKVFRESLVIEKNNIRAIIPFLMERVEAIRQFFTHVADVGVPTELESAYKDPYAGRTWYPYKQLFGVLGLSVFSKALLTEIHRHTPDPAASILAPGRFLTRPLLAEPFNPLEKVARLKAINDKLATLLQESGSSPDIEGLRPVTDIFAFLKGRYLKCLMAIDGFSEFANKSPSLFNVIEECELSIWSTGKRPVGSFVWRSNDVAEIVGHVSNFSAGYKRDYLIRDLGYGHYKYILFEYDRLHFSYPDADLARLFDYDIDEDDGLQIQREHIFAQSAVNYASLKEVWLTTTSENYDDWIWELGNITLLEHNLNIGGAGNKSIWEKADVYLKSQFQGTRALALDIKRMKELIDASATGLADDDKARLLGLPYKLLLEIRNLELLTFTYYRFA